MLDSLRVLPDVVLIVMAAAVFLACAAATGPLAARGSPESPRSPAALEAYKIIVNFTAILLSFCLVQAQGTLRATDATVSREAGAMSQLDRVLLRYNSPGTDRIRPLLRDYMASVLDDDWPALRSGGGAPASAQRLAMLSRAVQTLDDGVAAKPQLFGEMLKQLDTLNDIRQERVDASSTGLPIVLWQAVGSLCTLLLLLSCLIRVPGRLVAIGGHAMAIGMLVALVFVVDQPFKGDTAASPAPIERALALAKTRTE